LDDRDNVDDDDYVLLIVDSDLASADHLLSVARKNGFKGVIETRTDEAVRAANDIKPDAITLVPNGGGWIALEALKRDLSTRHIPVQVITSKDQRQRALTLGAFAFFDASVTDETLATGLDGIRRFLDREVKNLLVVEDDANQRKAILALIGNGDVEVSTAASGDEALAALRSTHFDCMVVDLGLPDMSGFDLLERLKRELGLYDLPVIVYTAKQLSQKEETALRRLAETIIIKDARSPERLLAETALFLHRPSERFSAAGRRMLEEEQKIDPVLAGKKILVVDDDVRNIFSLTSLLERRHMEVLFAENGKDAIQLLENTNDVDAILVDVMMPGMDGYATMREIRKMQRYKDSPIIALTAKAMKADREKCVEAGASDYISKPADVDRLLSILRLYLGN
jgi:CheY-like chemotaxis protein